MNWRLIARPVASNSPKRSRRSDGRQGTLTTTTHSLTSRSLVTPATRVTAGTVARLARQLGDRDLGVLHDLERVRLLTGRQLERLHFTNHQAPGRARSRTMQRLANDHAVTTLERRIGGVRAGSAGLIYTLDTAGQRALRLLDIGRDNSPARRPWTPGLPFIRHTLATSELYVSLREVEREKSIALVEFQTEPKCWWPDGLGGVIKPDAFLIVSNGRVNHLWWAEIDMGTESLPTIRRKLDGYLSFVRRGQLGPQGGIPRVLFAVTSTARQAALFSLIERLPEPASELFHSTLQEAASQYVSQRLMLR